MLSEEDKKRIAEEEKYRAEIRKTQNKKTPSLEEQIKAILYLILIIIVVYLFSC